MSEEELRKNDILFQIDMQLYNEFNDKLCEMDEHLGDIYSLRDIEEVKQAEKEKERKLLREAINKLQKENKELKNADLTSVYMKGFYDGESKWKTKIKARIKELVDIKNKNIDYCSRDFFHLERAIKLLEELLN